MELQDKIARYQEIERRGLLSQLPPEKQAIWAEIKNRGLVNNEQPQQDPYSGLDKAKYTLRAAGEGATFGLGDLVAGSTNVLANDLAQATNGQGLMGKIEGASNFGKHILVPFSQLWDPNLKKGRNEFVREQARFTEAHPGLNFTGELVGGLVTGVGGAGKKLAQTAGKQGIKALAKEGAREGTKFGALYGAGSGATQNEGYLSGKDALIGAGIGAASGAVLGYAVPPVVAGIGRIAGIVKPGQIAKAVNPGQVAETVENTANNVALKRLVSQNPELVEQSIKEGTPLINIADRKLFRTTRGAVSTNPEAEQILSDYARKFNSEKAGKVENLINQQLGEKSSAGAIQDILDEGRRVYQPIYDEVMKAGDLQIPIKNQRVLNAFSEVLKDYPELDKLPATDIRVLDLVKQKLDDKIGVAVRKGENNKARMLLQAKNELIGQIDAKVPQYAEARKAFKAMKDLEELVSQGQNVKQLGREELAQLYQKTAPEERGAIRAGIRDVLIRDLDRINSEGANSVKKVFSNSMLGKLKRIGLSDDKIAKAIAKEDLANSNIQGVFGGSNTAQKIADILNNTQGETSLGRAIFQPARTAKRYGIKAVDYLVNKIQNSSPAETAKLMTDPAYLKSEYERLYGGINKIVKGGNKGKGGIVDAIGNKLKEEGGYAMKPLDKNVNSLGEPVAKTEEGVKNFNKWFKGSKVVDEQGSPIVVYHGTSKNFNAFDPSKRGELTGAKSAKEGFWFVDDNNTAKSYAEFSAENSEINKLLAKQKRMEKQKLFDWREYDELTRKIEDLELKPSQEQETVMPVYLQIKKPISYDAKNKTFMEAQEEINEVLKKAKNADGVIIKNLKDAVNPKLYDKPATHYMVKNPNQIKSVKNQGTFDPKNPNIYKSLIGGLGISQILKNKERK